MGQGAAVESGSARRAKASAGRVCVSVHKHRAGMDRGCSSSCMNPGPGGPLLTIPAAVVPSDGRVEILAGI